MWDRALIYGIISFLGLDLDHEPMYNMFTDGRMRGRYMNRYMSIHRAPGMSKEEFAANGADIVNGRYGQHIMSHINFLSGTIVNFFDAESEEDLEREFERVGWPFEEIHEVHLSASTDDLRSMGEA